MPVLPTGQRLKFNRSDLGVKVEFAEGGKPESPEKNPQSQIEIDNSQPTCGAQDLIPGHRGGRRD